MSLDVTGKERSMSLVKRQKTDGSLIAGHSADPKGGVLPDALKDGIVLEPNTGGGSIMAGCFNPSGSLIATAGADRVINIWNFPQEVLGPDAEALPINMQTIVGHKGAITSLAWSRQEESLLFSGSADKSVAVWDIETGTKLRKLRGHKLVVEQVSSLEDKNLIVSCGDDGALFLWDIREKVAAKQYKTDYPLLSCVVNHSSTTVYTSGIDPTVHALDLTNFDAPIWTAESHKDTVTGLAISLDDAVLMSRSQDGTVRSYNAKAYVSNNKSRAQPGVYDGSVSQFDNVIRCKLSENRLITGGDDKYLTVWDVTSRKLIKKLGGNQGAVLDVDFHPKLPHIVLNTSTDGACIVRSL